MKNEIKPISLSVLMNELYKISNRFVYYSYGVQALLFAINILLIIYHPQESNEYIWIHFTASLAIIISSLVLLHRSKKYYEIGESVRKLDIIEKNFPNAANKAKKSYLISTIPSYIINKAQNNPTEATEYSNSKDDKYGKLIENIQENSFFTSEIMRHYSRLILIVLVTVSVILALSIVYGFFILSDTSVDIVLTKSIASYLGLFINLIFTLNIIDHYILLCKKSTELKGIDEKLNSVKNNPQEDDIITSFTEYNCILCNALPCPEFVYKYNKSKLNKVWNNRITDG